MELDASLSGNAYVYRADRDLLQILDPQKMEVETNGREKVGYLYWPKGIGYGNPRALLMDEVAHWAPLPHPGQQFMGASWVEVVATELKTDIKMIRHQEKFYDHAATPNLYVKVKGTMRPEARERLREELDLRYRGFQNAWKTVVMDQDAEMQVVGANFEQMDYVNTQTSTEARIASAAGVPTIIIALKAGLDAATYSNYGMAMRAFADHLIRPNWNSAVAALGQIVTAPTGSDLWYDDKNVSALRQDKSDEAQILQTQATAVVTLVRDGFDPDAAVEAITSNDIGSLKGKHSGNLSVQLQPSEPADQKPQQLPATTEEPTEND
jgi:HK97 family phage portal protein